MQWCSGEGKRGAGEGAAQRVSDHFQKLYSTFGIWSTRMFVSLRLSCLVSGGRVPVNSFAVAGVPHLGRG